MCTLKKYRHRDPNTIEAVQFTGENGDEGDDLTLLQGEFLLIDNDGRLSKLSSEEATQIILKGEGLDERVRI